MDRVTCITGREKWEEGEHPPEVSCTGQGDGGDGGGDGRTVSSQTVCAQEVIEIEIEEDVEIEMEEEGQGKLLA
jgi:hypothetical protein